MIFLVYRVVGVRNVLPRFVLCEFPRCHKIVDSPFLFGCIVMFFSLDVENVVALDGILSTCVEVHVHAMVMVIMNFYRLYRRAKNFKSGLITDTMI